VRIGPRAARWFSGYAGSAASQCDDAVVLRSVTLGLALSVLAAACALVEPPAPPGTYMVQIEVRNEQPNPVRFAVYVRGQPLAAAVQPPSVPAGPSRTAVTFYLPIADDWDIAIDGGDIGGITGQGVDPTFRRECPLVIELPATGDWQFGCGSTP
jgi:hypothetical protein